MEMATKKISFPITDGVRRNAETGVEIVAMEFMGRPTGQYEIRVPDTHRAGYSHAGYEYSLRDAREAAAERVVEMREAIARDHAEALAAR